MSEDWYLHRPKRDWVPERLWRLFAHAGIAVCWPFNVILTRKRGMGDGPAN